ncbi:hypothetical protein SCP_0603760 [Sparassis crispa]|uniref:Uncharacterized protein n=1 Tax=Sparassis crispa TaxID=139825 RepID=A0A401GQ99_9APHY|nr:hypothetical protein SCP_0603760 [Sparassis crispa]GBE84397.1 hypothetical protein SCP_0603760 [Sparassis crispa]
MSPSTESESSGKQSSTQKSPSGGKREEASFHILPHPATNDPRDLEGPQLGGGLNSNPEIGAFHAREPYVPSPALMQNVEQPKTREELRARAAELNQKSQKHTENRG